MDQHHDVPQDVDQTSPEPDAQADRQSAAEAAARIITGRMDARVAELHPDVATVPGEPA